MFSYVYVRGISHDAHWVDTCPLGHGFLQDGLYSFEPVITADDDGAAVTPVEAVQHWLHDHASPARARTASAEPAVPVIAAVDDLLQTPADWDRSGVATSTLDAAIERATQSTEPDQPSCRPPGATVRQAGATVAVRTVSVMGLHATLADQLRRELDRLGGEIGRRLVDGRGAVLCQATYSFLSERDGNGDPQLLALTVYDPSHRDRHITALSPRYDLLSNAFPQTRAIGAQDPDTPWGVSWLLGDADRHLHPSRDVASVYLFASPTR